MEQSLNKMTEGTSGESKEVLTREDKALSFEDALAELEKTVQRMQRPDCSLDDALALFVRGSELTKLCHDKLAEVESKITMLTETADGELKEEQLQPD